MKISLKDAKKVVKGGSEGASGETAASPVDAAAPLSSPDPAECEDSGASVQAPPSSSPAPARADGGRNAARDADAMMERGALGDSQIDVLQNRQRLTDALVERFPWERVLGKMEELMDAKRPVAHKGIVIEWVPDVKIQAKMVELILAYREGRPVERSEIITREVSSFEQIMEKASQNPAYLRALKRMIEKAIATAESRTSDTDNGKP